MKIYNIFLFGTVILILAPIFYLSFTVNTLCYYIFILIWALGNLFYGWYKSRSKGDFRLLSEEEWQEFKNKNVIHYSNILDAKEGINDIVIPAHSSFKVNHLLPKEYRHKGFVWFHLCDDNVRNEPNLKSYLHAHFGEGNPRKQKLIVQFEQLPKENIYIHTKTGYIVVEGDLKVTALVLNKFKWYNDKIYLFHILSNVCFDILLIFYYCFIQLNVRIKDRQKEKKVVSDI